MVAVANSTWEACLKKDELQLQPVTNLHPEEMITPLNIRACQVGVTGEVIKREQNRDGDFVKMRLKITDPVTIYFDTSSHHKEGNTVPVKFKRKAIKLDAFSMDEIDVQIPDEAPAILDRVSARLDEAIAMIQAQVAIIMVPVHPIFRHSLSFLYVSICLLFLWPRPGFLSLSSPYRTPRKTCIPAECLKRFILSSFWVHFEGKSVKFILLLMIFQFFYRHGEGAPSDETLVDISSYEISF